MKHFFVIIFLFAILTGLYGQNFTLPLWEKNIPNYQPTDEKEIRDTTNAVRISFVQNPDIAVFLPTKKEATGKAVVIFPGGGYMRLAYDYEGTDIAKLFNAHGIAAVVVKYRLPISKSNITPYLTPLLDAKRAIRLTRHHAENWNIKADQIGIIGFSAGGHLASTLGTHFDSGDSASEDPVERLSSRPDFMILIYPVITMSKEYTHMGSRIALLGENPDPELIKYYSNELQVKPDTPPAFLIHASDDGAVPVENSLMFYKSLVQNKIPAEMHIYPAGGHGFALATSDPHLKKWPLQLFAWLDDCFN